MPKPEERKELVLRLVLEEFIKTGKSVSSRSVSEKIKKWRSSTIRYEMQKLKEEGFLEDEYFSSGKVPTEEAFLWYTKKLLEEESFEVPRCLKRVLGRISDEASDFYDLRRRVLRILSEILKSTTIYLGKSEGLEMFGLKEIFLRDEKIEKERMLSIFALIEEIESIIKSAAGCVKEGKIAVLIGRDLPFGKRSGMSLSYIKFEKPREFVLSTISPIRSRYDVIFGSLAEAAEILSSSFLD